MKTILRQFFNKENVANSSKFDLDYLLNVVNKHPVALIWGIWTLYLGLDVIARFSSDLSFTSIKIIALNYVGGGIFQQFWFFVFLPNVYFLKKWKLPFALFILLFSCFIVIKIYLLGSPMAQDINVRSFVVIELVRIFHFLIYTTAIWGLVVAIYRESEKNRLEMEFEKLQIEHKSLQLSPHFVLNLFSIFAASILPLSRSLYTDILYFTNILSYSYKDPQLPNFLHEEVEAIEDYITCQKRRFRNKLSFVFSKNFSKAACSNLPIPKWTLMTFIENVFKHGNCFMSDFPCVLTLNLTKSAKGFRVFSFSMTNAKGEDASKKSTGFGIDAVNRVLNYHFIDHYQLFISDTATEFSLFLYIEYEGKFTDWVA